MSQFKIALVQMSVTPYKNNNLERAAEMVRQASSEGADVVVLPEMFFCPIEPTDSLVKYAEEIPGPITELLGNLSKECKIFLIAGSYAERKDGNLHNTCTVFDPEGRMIAKFTKLHPFDIEIPGKVYARESDFLIPGKELKTVETPFCKIGLGLCYDIRFPELAKLYADRGCQLLVFPSAFSAITGPDHWDLLQRSRALDNQVYVATASPARDDSHQFVLYGHSSVVDPWGKVVATSGEEQTIVYADINLQYMADVRERIPVTKQRRHDLYKTIDTSTSREK